jgi:RimJ/RimL family protein N-acetyltransferase
VDLDPTAVELTTEVVPTERLVLRPFRPDDVDAVFRASQDPETQRWISAIPVPCTRDVARQYVEEVAPRVRAEGTGCRW